MAVFTADGSVYISLRWQGVPNQPRCLPYLDSTPLIRPLHTELDVKSFKHGRYCGWRYYDLLLERGYERMGLMNRIIELVESDLLDHQAIFLIKPPSELLDYLAMPWQSRRLESIYSKLPNDWERRMFLHGFCEGVLIMRRSPVCEPV